MRSFCLFLSNMWSGTKHDNKVPVVTIGGLGGKLETGRALDYFESGDDNRKSAESAGIPWHSSSRHQRRTS